MLVRSSAGQMTLLSHNKMGVTREGDLVSTKMQTKQRETSALEILVVATFRSGKLLLVPP